MESTLTKVIDKKIDSIKDLSVQVKENLDNTKNQLDKDRLSFDQVQVILTKVEAQQDVIIQNLTDFKMELRQVVQDAVRDEVVKVLGEELKKIEIIHPKKTLVIYKSFWSPVTEFIQKIRNRHDLSMIS